MAEAIGLGASILGIATFGAQVVTKLRTFSKSYTTADEKISELSASVALTTSILTDLGNTVGEYEIEFRIKAENFVAVKAACEMCFGRLKEALKKAKKSEEYGKGKEKMNGNGNGVGGGMSAWEKLMFALGGEQDLKDLVMAIERAKSNLQLLLDSVNLLVLKGLSKKKVLTEDQSEDLKVLIQHIPALLMALRDADMVNWVLKNPRRRGSAFSYGSGRYTDLKSLDISLLGNTEPVYVAMHVGSTDPLEKMGGQTKEEEGFTIENITSRGQFLGEEGLGTNESGEDIAKATSMEPEITMTEAPDKTQHEEVAPVEFNDAVGRKFSFPFHKCQTWFGIEELIKQVSTPVNSIWPQVREGRYDLTGPNGEIILPQLWESVIKPGLSITMHLLPTSRSSKQTLELHENQNRSPPLPKELYSGRSPEKVKVDPLSKSGASSKEEGSDNDLPEIVPPTPQNLSSPEIKETPTFYEGWSLECRSIPALPRIYVFCGLKLRVYPESDDVYECITKPFSKDKQELQGYVEKFKEGLTELENQSKISLISREIPESIRREIEDLLRDRNRAASDPWTWRIEALVNLPKTHKRRLFSFQKRGTKYAQSDTNWLVVLKGHIFDSSSDLLLFDLPERRHNPFVDISEEYYPDLILNKPVKGILNAPLLYGRLPPPPIPIMAVSSGLGSRYGHSKLRSSTHSVSLPKRRRVISPISSVSSFAKSHTSDAIVVKKKTRHRSGATLELAEETKRHLSVEGSSRIASGPKISHAELFLPADAGGLQFSHTEESRTVKSEDSGHSTYDDEYPDHLSYDDEYLGVPFSETTEQAIPYEIGEVNETSFAFSSQQPQGASPAKIGDAGSRGSSRELKDDFSENIIAGPSTPRRRQDRTSISPPNKYYQYCRYPYVMAEDMVKGEWQAKNEERPSDYGKSEFEGIWDDKLEDQPSQEEAERLMDEFLATFTEDAGCSTDTGDM
ncbi:hypothetical protein B7463_g2056, partial [Scytalidium lignicola]